MSEEEQMEVRKNLGLYYEEASQEKIGKWTDEEFVGTWAKISDDIPTKENLIKLVITGNNPSEYYPPAIKDIEDGYNIGYIVDMGGGNSFLNAYFKVVTKGDDKGLYASSTIQMIQMTGGDVLLYYRNSTIYKIPEKYLPEIKIEPEIETVTFLQSLESIQASNQINLNDLFSNEDVNILKKGKIVYGKYSSGNGDLQSYIIIPKKSIMGSNDEFLIIGNCINNNIGYNINYYLRYETNIEKYRVLRDTLFVSGLPTNEMTIEQIEALGFTVNSFYNGSNLKHIYNYSQNIIYSVLCCSRNIICFQDDVNRYKLTNNIVSISCTITPL